MCRGTQPASHGAQRPHLQEHWAALLPVCRSVCVPQKLSHAPSPVLSSRGYSAPWSWHVLCQTTHCVHTSQCGDAPGQGPLTPPRLLPVCKRGWLCPAWGCLTDPALATASGPQHTVDVLTAHPIVAPRHRGNPGPRNSCTEGSRHQGTLAPRDPGAMAPSTMGPGHQRVSLAAVNPLSCPQGEGFSPPPGEAPEEPVRNVVSPHSRPRPTGGKG